VGAAAAETTEGIGRAEIRGTDAGRSASPVIGRRPSFPPPTLAKLANATQRNTRFFALPGEAEQRGRNRSTVVGRAETFAKLATQHPVPRATGGRRKTAGTETKPTDGRRSGESGIPIAIGRAFLPAPPFLPEARARSVTPGPSRYRAKEETRGRSAGRSVGEAVPRVRRRRTDRSTFERSRHRVGKEARFLSKEKGSAPSEEGKLII